MGQVHIPGPGFYQAPVTRISRETVTGGDRDLGLHSGILRTVSRPGELGEVRDLKELDLGEMVGHRTHSHRYHSLFLSQNCGQRWGAW